MRSFALGLAVLVVAALGMPLDASAQNRRTADKLEELEQQIRDLQGAVYGRDQQGAPVRFQGANPDPASGVAPGAEAANLQLRIGALESEVQRLTGEIERLTFQFNQQQDQIRRLVSLAYPEYEGDPGFTAPAGGPLREAGGPIDLVMGGGGDAEGSGYADAEGAYSAGRSALLEARYADAERAFLAVIDQFPNSERVGDATYYLGETYLAQSDLGGAARTFLDFVRNYPEHERAAEAHLKLGQAFARADKTQEACRVWLRGLREYPDMDDDIKERMEGMRASTCS